MKGQFLMSAKRIAIFSDNLKVGGIQKSLANILLSNAFSNYEVDVFLFDKETFFDISSIGNNIHIHYLKPMPYLFKAIPFDIIYKLCKPDLLVTEHEYELAIDFDSYQNATALGALKAKAKKRVLWIHNDVQIKKREETKYNILWTLMQGKYKYFDEFAAVSEGIVEPFRTASKRFDCPIHIIPNIINAKEVQTRSLEKCDFTADQSKLNIVSVGRLCHQKGYDIMLNDISEVYKKRKDIYCYIIGDGPKKDALIKQTEELGLEDVVCFAGNLSNPFPLVKQADVFCLESRYEGQGMVLWEAKALGLNLVFPKHLEKYNPDLAGVDNVPKALIDAKKYPKAEDDLIDYNNAVISALKKLADNEEYENE